MKIDIVDWTEAKEHLKALDRYDALVDLIEECSNGDPQDPFYLASYRYGEYIRKDGMTVLDESSPHYNAIKANLDYDPTTNPFGILLKNNAEVFIETSDRSIPLRIYEEGAMTGLSHILDNSHDQYRPKFIWDISAGTRSVFMLPKIASLRDHKRLCKRYKLQNEMPKHVLDHWHIFKSIAHATDDSWRCIILYFPKSIVNQLNTPQWRPLKRYLTEKAWKGTGYWRNTYHWNVIYSYVSSQYDIQLSAYDLTTLKHIFGIIVGQELAYKPGSTDKNLPLATIQEAYYETYGLKSKGFLATVMTPCYEAFHRSNTQPVYYSFQNPTHPEVPSRHDSLNSNIQYSVHFEGILDRMCDAIVKLSNAPYSPIVKALENITFNFSHADPDNTFINDDARFNTMLYSPQEPFKNTEFPKGNTFLRSYLQIQQK